PGPGVGGAPWDRTPPPPTAPLPPPTTDLPSLAGSADAPATAGGSTWGQDDGTPKPTAAEAWAEVSAMDKPPQPKRFQNRPSRGGGGGGALRIFGLVGVLVTIAILGILAVKVLSGTESAPEATGAATTAAPSPTANPVTGDASAAACTANRQAVQDAVVAYIAQTGGPPKDLAALVAANYLTDVPPNIVIVPGMGSGTVQVEGTGPCA
ncbi:MAG: type II secretion system protein, partial [Microthrixaceae bacterium]